MVLIPGDLFHLKNPRAYTPADIISKSHMIEGLGVPVLTIAGNHDLESSSRENLRRSPYFLLTQTARNMVDLSEGLTYTTSTPGGIPIHVHGIPYIHLDQLDPELAEVDAKAKENGGINILLLHADITPNEAPPLIWETRSSSDLLKAIPHVQIVALGHIHLGFPVQSQISTAGVSQTILKPWSFTRVVNDLYVRAATLEHSHRPAVALIHLDEQQGRAKFEYRTLEHRPFTEVFEQESLARDEVANEKIKRHVAQIGNSLAELQEMRFHPGEIVSRLQISARLKDTLLRYLEG